MRKLREGQWFAVPVEGDGFAVGRVVRAPRRGETLVGYFFGPVRSDMPVCNELRAYDPDDAVMISRFRDAALVSGKWPLIPCETPWERDAWPMPEFHVPLSREVTGESWAVTYSEDDPSRSLRRRRIAPEDEAKYPRDGLLPPTHVEYQLAEKLGVPHLDDEESSQGEIADEVGVRYFLLVPPDAADGVVRQLRDHGFDDLEVVGGRGEQVDIVVFQRGDIADLQTSVEDVETRLTALAREVDGEYDGLEWALPSE